MAKDYKKLYNKLKHCLEGELKTIKKILPTLNDRYEIVDKIEYDGQITLLEWLLSEYLPELEARKWNNIFLNKEEFKEWKKEINK